MIRLKDVEMEYPNGTRAIRGISAAIEDGEFVFLVGPSGSGKSTIIKMLTGEEVPTAGRIMINGFSVSNIAERQIPMMRRTLGVIFQDFRLIEKKTVYENLEFVMRAVGMPKKEIKQRITYVLQLVGLEKKAENFPSELSGGEQQRVAIARALVKMPRILLLDEPLSNLDAKLRVDMRAELKRLHHETGTTIIYVTHDQVEALTMSTRIALYRKGELVQVAPPLELYDNPVNLYTADFIGNPSINFVKGTAQVEAGGMRVDSPLGQLGFERGDMTEAAPQSGSVDVTIGVRPEQLSISRQADDAHWVEGHVYSGMPAGSETLVSVRVGDTMLTVKELGSTHYASDEPVYLGFNPKKVNVFETKSENLIKYCV